jgi:MFS family permease
LALNIPDKALEIFHNSRPILLVLMLAALIVFINSYPEVPDIVDETSDYRNKIKHDPIITETNQDDTTVKPPGSPVLPNTISPVVTPEEVDDIVNPEPKPKPVPSDIDNDTVIDTPPERDEPSLEIKLLTGFLNVAPLILIAAIGGFGIYFLFKYKKHLTLRSMFGVAIGLVAVCTIIFIGYISLYFFEFLYEYEVDYDMATLFIVPISAIFGVWLSFNIISKKTTTFKRNIGLAFAGAFMGAFLASFLPFWIIFILLIAISLFDIYSVRFGPIKKIMELESNEKHKKAETKTVYRKLEEPVLNVSSDGAGKASNRRAKDNDKREEKVIKEKTENTDHMEAEGVLKDNELSSEPKGTRSKSSSVIFTTEPATNLKVSKKLVRPKKSDDDEFDLILMYDNPKWSLGLGDFVIYSMFTSAVLTYFLIYLPYYIFYTPELGLILPWLLFFICGLSILVGFFLTLKLLEKRDYLPGLPISIGLGFVVFIICIMILQLINYMLYSEFAIII